MLGAFRRSNARNLDESHIPAYVPVFATGRNAAKPGIICRGFIHSNNRRVMNVTLLMRPLHGFPVPCTQAQP